MNSLNLMTFLCLGQLHLLLRSHHTAALPSSTSNGLRRINLLTHAFSTCCSCEARRKSRYSVIHLLLLILLAHRWISVICCFLNTIIFCSTRSCCFECLVWQHLIHKHVCHSIISLIFLLFLSSVLLTGVSTLPTHLVDAGLLTGDYGDRLWALKASD